jgi:hypothetical protein
MDSNEVWTGASLTGIEHLRRDEALQLGSKPIRNASAGVSANPVAGKMEAS